MSLGEGHFGQWVRWSAARKGWNRLDLAKELGVSSKTITNLERRDTPEGVADTTIAALARVFSVTEAEILGEWDGVHYQLGHFDYVAVEALAEAAGVTTSEMARRLTLKALGPELDALRASGAVDLGTTTRATGEPGTPSPKTQPDTPDAAATLPPRRVHSARPSDEPKEEPPPKAKPRRRKAG